jgi:SWI/SNF-related matrix-associated actin-dependent regulator 1 of chromatin subfamily A
MAAGAFLGGVIGGGAPESAAERERFIAASLDADRARMAAAAAAAAAAAEEDAAAAARAARLASTPLPGSDLMLRLFEAVSSVEHAALPAMILSAAASGAADAEAVERRMQALAPLVSDPLAALLSLIANGADAIAVADEAEAAAAVSGDSAGETSQAGVGEAPKSAAARHRPMHTSQLRFLPDYPKDEAGL